MIHIGELNYEIKKQNLRASKVSFSNCFHLET